MAADETSTPGALTTIDLEALTAQLCEEGGFTRSDEAGPDGAKSPQGSGRVETPATTEGEGEPESAPEAPDGLAGPGAAGTD
jgi:hypothetical protein